MVARRSLEQQDVAISLVKFGAYPNPNKGQFTIQLKSSKVAKGELLIIDPRGRVITKTQIQLTGNDQLQRFDIRNKSTGLYIVKVITAEGTQIAKVVVQR